VTIATTPETEPFWEHARRELLALPFCRNCEQYFFYPRFHCPRCWSEDLEWRAVSGEGRLASYAIVAVAPGGYTGPVPYVVALVDLREGPRLMSNIVGVDPEPGNLAIGMALSVVFDHDGELSRPLFRPAGPDA
jgi:uncharacterized OB-fold protein